MAITVDHKPANDADLWNIHVWQAACDENNVWDTKGAPCGDLVEFQLPALTNPRFLQIMFHFTTPATGQDTWEASGFVYCKTKAGKMRLDRVCEEIFLELAMGEMLRSRFRGRS